MLFNIFIKQNVTIDMIPTGPRSELLVEQALRHIFTTKTFQLKELIILILNMNLKKNYKICKLSIKYEGGGGEKWLSALEMDKVYKSSNYLNYI